MKLGRGRDDNSGADGTAGPRDRAEIRLKPADWSPAPALQGIF
ncbi:hypothetical protein [Lyngbya sp. CCY1209]|nr:hypothetical protein [Lyngbya sp. CCY1209]